MSADEFLSYGLDSDISSGDDDDDCNDDDCNEENAPDDEIENKRIM